jgi:hypothetical protein
MMPAWRSWTPVRSFNGSTWTIVATGVRSPMNSPTCTSRSETTPEMGARTTASASFFARERTRRGGPSRRLLAADVVDRGLVGGLGHFQARLGRLQIDRRQDAARGQGLRALAARGGVFLVGQRILHRSDLVVGRRRVGGVDGAVHAVLGAGLPQGAFRARQRQRILLRAEPDQRVADADLAADLDEHRPDDPGGLGADSRLVRGHERAGEIHLPLDRHPLNRRGVDGDRRPAGAPGLAAGRLGVRGREGRTGQGRADPP